MPVTAETLDMVANHVKHSAPRSEGWSILLDEVYLTFVYGPEQSLTHFIEVGNSGLGFCEAISSGHFGNLGSLKVTLR